MVIHFLFQKFIGNSEMFDYAQVKCFIMHGSNVECLYMIYFNEYLYEAGDIGLF